MLGRLNMNKKWEYFQDPSYYDMYAVRPIGDKEFNSKLLFHVTNESEASRLAELLNSKEINNV
jgi:hypothetical protein